MVQHLPGTILLFTIWLIGKNFVTFEVSAVLDFWQLAQVLVMMYPSRHFLLCKNLTGRNVVW